MSLVLLGPRCWGERAPPARLHQFTHGNSRTAIHARQFARSRREARYHGAMPIRFKPPDFDPETLGLRVLAHIAMDEDLLPRFLTLSGLDGESLKARAADPALLGGLLDFVMFDDALVLRMAEALAVEPEAFARARARLPGGREGHGE
jgi:hypothetical protein